MHPIKIRKFFIGGAAIICRKFAWIPALLWFVPIGNPLLDARAATEPYERSSLEKAWREFSARDLSGRIWSSRRVNNQVTIIHFWTTYCPSCRKEMENLRRMHRAHRHRGLEIIGVNLEGIARPALSRFLAVHRIDWPQIQEAGGFEGRLARLFQVTRVPSVFIVDRQGGIRPLPSAHGGYFNSAVDAALKSGGAPRQAD